MKLREVEDKVWDLLTNNNYLVLAENKDRAELQVHTGFVLAILALAKAIDRLAQSAEKELEAKG